MAWVSRWRGTARKSSIGTIAVLGAVSLLSSCIAEPNEPVVPTETGDAAIVALDIVPAGAYSPPSWGDVGKEARMYDSLTPKGGSVTDADVAAGFKSAYLGANDSDGVNSVDQPIPGLRIVRDGFNVPHITAETDAKAVWGVGWASAEFSPFVYEVFRRNGRLAAAGVTDLNPIAESLNRRVLEPTGAADRILQTQVDRLANGGPDERAVLADIDAFVDGYNAKLNASFSILPRWTRLDIIASSAIKADWWGRGSTRIDGTLPGDESEPTLQDSGAIGELTAPTRYRSAKASNFALISGQRSETGHPLLIGGPQIGYTYPGIAFEVDINSPNIDMRGLTAPAYPGYVFVGRGPGFAWTLNVAFDAETGVRTAVRLCEDGITYRVDGRCEPFESTDLGSMIDLSNLFGQQTRVALTTTQFGPVDRIDTEAGIVYVIQRPGLGHDVDDLIAFRAVNYNQVSGPSEFRQSVQRSPQAYNVGFVDSAHIAAFRTCWCVAPNVGPTDVQDWSSIVVPVDGLPSTVDPAGGIVTNWNEPLVTTAAGDWVPPAPGEYRREWYEAFNRTTVHSVASLAGAMNGEATRWTLGNVRFTELVPQLGGVQPPEIRATDRSTAIQMIMSFGGAE